jgi:hypothetical protein
MNDTDKIVAAVLAAACATKSTGEGVEFFVDAYERVLKEMEMRSAVAEGAGKLDEAIVHKVMRGQEGS